jgi:SAM-dependent methyltransferase
MNSETVLRAKYTEHDLSELVKRVQPRRGWDFSRMSATRHPVPWEYTEVVRRYLTPNCRVLDIGTGGGEELVKLATHFGEAVGIDVDPEMVEVASSNAVDMANLRFHVSTDRLEAVEGQFDVILDRHAPFDLGAVRRHLVTGGYFVTQQVGERNMGNVRAALGRPPAEPPISAEGATRGGLTVVAFAEYDVEYVVHDVESLVFWLTALDYRHADISGAEAMSSVDTFNRILLGMAEERGFVTNEHRYLLVGAVRPPPS